MSASIAELSSLTPPSDDGAIARALAELESKLGAWSDAMTMAQRTLVDEKRRASEFADAVSDDAPDADATERDDNNATAAEAPPPDAEVAAAGEPAAGSENDALLDRLGEAMRQSDHLARELGTDTETENETPNEPPTTSDATDEDFEELLATIDSEVAKQLRARHAEAGGNVSMREICDAYFAEVTETENLLATLEPEVAKAIRVQYRLFNGRKSIRQLVDEYEPPKENSKKRRSWWRG